MRVALLGCVGVSLTQFRGRLIDAMVARGHEVIGCAADRDPLVVADLDARGARFHQVPLDRTGLNPLRDMGSVLALRRIFTDLRPDMLLAYTMKPMAYGALAARLARVGRIFTMVEGMGYAFGDGGERRRRFLRAVQQPLYRLAFSLSNATFVLNPDDRDLLRRRRLAPRRHELVLLNGIGIDLARFAYAPPPLARPSFLLVGRLIKDKGVIAYAEAARRVKAEFPKARFALLGGFDSAPGALAPEQVEAWRREGIIDYLGTVHDVRPVIEDTDVFVLPSTYREGVPRSILEAMAMGRPIITTDAPGCRETVRHGENGFLVAKHDIEGLVAAMRRFAAAPELALPMGLASRRLVEERFDDRDVNATILATMRL